MPSPRPRNDGGPLPAFNAGSPAAVCRLGQRPGKPRDHHRFDRSRSSNASFSLVAHEARSPSVYWTTSSGSDDGGSCCGGAGSVTAPSINTATARHLPVSALTVVAGFLDRHELDLFRCSNSVWRAAADAVAPRPLGACEQQPSPTFLRCPAVLDPAAAPRPSLPPTSAAAAVGLAKRPASPWLCLGCDKLSVREARSCQYCHALMAKSACRVFVGQLVKRRTAELLNQVVGFVAPTIRVLRIEPHTNSDTAATGESRGCAWMYLRNVSDAIRLMHVLHRRAFFDVDADERGGTWLAPQGTTTAAVFHAFAQVRNAHPARSVLSWLPPSPVKVEIPAGSLLLARAAEVQAAEALRVAPHVHVGVVPVATPPVHRHQHPHPHHQHQPIAVAALPLLPTRRCIAVPTAPYTTAPSRTRREQR